MVRPPETATSHKESGGEISRFDCPPAVLVEHHGEGSASVGVMGAEVYDTTRQSANWTEIRVLRTSETNDFTSNAILLAVEGEGGETSLQELRIWCSGQIESCMSDEELDTLKVKGLGVGWGSGVFTRPKQVEEGNHDHISNASNKGARTVSCHA